MPDEYKDPYRHIRQVWANIWSLPDDRPIYEWAEENIKLDETSAQGGYFKLALTPWLKKPFEDFQNKRVRSISFRSCAQGGKSQFLLVVYPWTLSEDPGTALWATNTNPEMKFFKDTRLKSTILNCKALVEKGFTEKHFRGMEIHWPGAPTLLTGAQSKAALQSKPVRYGIFDEIRDWPKGHVEMAEKRQITYPNRKAVKTSTAGEEGDEIDVAFMKGDQNVWNVPCMDCGEMSELLWDGIKFDKPEEDALGAIEFEKIIPTIRWECPKCGHPHKDTPAIRRHFREQGDFIPRNPNAPPEFKSYHWNALVLVWRTWRELVIEFLTAAATARMGNIQPLKDFINQSLGQSWEDRLGALGQRDLVEKAQVDYYLLGDVWPIPKYRIITADKQQKGGTHYWWVIRDWAADGSESRLVAYGRAETEEELMQYADDHNVSPHRRIVDCGYTYHQVLKFCADEGWHPYRGDKAKYFIVTSRIKKKRIRQSWTVSAEPVTQGMPGQTVNVIRWSNLAVKDLLATLSTGKVGNWTLPKKLDDEYIKQFTAEIRKQKRYKDGRFEYYWHKRHDDDHLRDCELMQLVAALSMGLMQAKVSGTGEDDNPQPEIQSETPDNPAS